jgi:Ca-activated chloride channel family protein
MRSILSKIPKWILFSVLAALGGAFLCLLSEPINLDNFFSSRVLCAISETAIWTGLICFGIALPVVLVQQVLLIGRVDFSKLLRTVGTAFVLGAVSGIFAQLLYGFLLNIFGRTLGELPRFPPWMLAGAGLGLSLSLAIPNLRLIYAALWGALGGLIGVSIFVVVGFVGLDEVLARFLGAGAIGFFIGLAVALAERASREGFIRVVWAPKEVTTVNLGARPITVGTGNEVSVRLPASTRYPSVVATFRLVGGVATMKNHMTDTMHTLRDGNRLNLGSIVIEVRLFV